MAAQGQTCAPVNCDLVSWWRAESDATDSAGSNHGALMSGAGFDSGEVGQAFSFDGVSAYVEVPPNPVLNPAGSFSLEAWIYALPHSGGPVLMGKWSDLGDYYNTRSYVIYLTPANAVGFSVSDAAHQGDGAFHKFEATTDPIPLSTWTHVGAVYLQATGTRQIYINGVKVAERTDPPITVLSADTKFSIGARMTTSTQATDFFAGRIDEASFYSRALSAGEMQAIYDAGNLGKCFGQLPPVLLVQPQSRTVNVGGTAAFSVQTGCDLYAYQWHFNGSDLAGATDSSYVIASAQPADAGTYSVTVSNAGGTVTSSNATLTVDSSPLCFGPPSGLVSWWAGDEAANDSIGGNNGALQSGAGFAPGKVSDAFSFDGMSGLIQIPDAPDLNFATNSPLTVELWAYRTGTQASMTILSKRAPNCGAFEYQMAVDPANGGLQFGGSAFTGVKTGLQLPTNTWIHLAATFDGATFRFYTNGALAATGTGTLGSTNNAPLTIGGSYGCPPFAGLLDEVCLYNRALSASEVQSVYLAGSKGKCYAPAPPVFLTQPQSLTVVRGQNANFSAFAGGSVPLSYQWRLNGVNLPGATNTSLALTNVQMSNAGPYSVVVTNSLGSMISSNAMLTVNLPVCAPAGSNLVGWWAAEANANDNNGTNDGRFINGPVFAAGKAGQAFDFDGVSRYVELSNNAALNPQGSFSFEGWIYPRQDAEMAIIDKWADTPDYPNQRSYNFSTIPGRGLRFAIADATNQNNASFQLFDVAGVLATNAWNHVAAVYDQSNGARRMYVNGVKVAERIDPPTTVYTTFLPASIGVEEISLTGRLIYFNGLIDELSFYSRALSAAELLTIYNADSTGKCPLAPGVLAQPQGQTVKAGTNVTFTARTRGSQPLAYQWRLNGVTLAGATNSSLTLGNVQPSQAGLYSLRVSNVLGAATSSDALLKVIVVTAFGNGQLLTNSQYSFGSSATIQLQNAYTNGDVFYTLNGSQPTFQSSFYSGPFTISNSVTLRALGYSADFFQYGELDPVAISIVPNYTLSVSTPGGGTVSVSPTNTPYPSGSVVTLTATPTAGWVFLQWLGDAAGTNPTNSVLMTRNKSAQALFGTTLSTTAAGGGSVVLNPTGGLYPYGTIVQVSAIPQPGKFFGLWGNAASGNLNPLSFLVTNANPTISSLFAALNSNQVGLAVAPIGHGQISLSPRSNAYAIGQNVTITATADLQQSFLGWGGDAAGAQNPLSVAMNQSKTIYANFTKNYRFSFEPLGGLGLSDGFLLNLVGEVGTAYRFEASSNFAAWTALATLTNYSGTLEYIDAGASGFVRRFYRAVPVP